MRPRLVIVVLLASLVVLAPAGSARAAFPGANGKIAYSFFQIWVVNPDGTGKTRLTDPTAEFNDIMPAWSPDGARLAFVRHCVDTDLCTGDDIYVMDANGGSQTLISNAPNASSVEPAWSPDGQKIVFATTRDGDYEIYTMNADGTSPANISNSHSSVEIFPAWSPDGQKIAFATNRDGDYEIYTMNPNGSGVTRLTTKPQTDTDPNWSPDGQKIAFTANVDESVWPEIYVVNANGTNQQNLSNNSISADQDPAWSPDGTRIAWDRTTYPPSYPPSNRLLGEIWVMNPDGSDKASLDVGPAYYLDWQPLNGSYPPPPYHVPKSASPIKVALVPVFKQCGTPGNPSNSKHASPLPVSSCNPPAPFSNVAGVGPSSQSRASLGVMPSNPATPANEADIALEASLTDIQTKTGADYNPNPSGPDLTAHARVRLTDLRNCTPTPCGGPYDKPATTTDTFLTFPVDCVEITTPNTGASCSANTSANALTPGFAQEGKGTVVQSFRVLVDDSGANGIRADSDDRIFMMQGVFAP
jgi:Tol biopolymer transport system component